MGKNNKKKNNKSKNKKKNNNTNSIFDVSTNNADKKYPFVSICTPTFNRRPFIKYMIKCFEHQTYPKERMEWIIIDDGSDKIKDLVERHQGVKISMHYKERRKFIFFCQLRSLVESSLFKHI